ncbi:MAG: RNA 2',3'-cyclic phosphodiesterase [Candidatus Marinimicrobia bacterium]|jgi:2'-5' RNA ligase|nr:RNA 2',3'-cyclic phosphodiesterase [Candidatus Neomarinimicrobiota bacterium]MDP6578207.1 RNA 2',3'-cyclic phosphodiesterase [Candidatus Neomarinimicrobiota bacterium]MDP7060799.1 RNA 2',3'-cyclic phosphodiesterase [Candidatus Neomarinimicrobiota bacterium]|tara:strand:- start:3721 stop:4296 length:576 start_codon:yes stop_codon:yes gene_type:complete
MPEKLIRTFIAIDTPETVTQVALSLQSSVKVNPKAVKWVRKENIHITLRYIGPTAPGEVDKINRLLNEIVGQNSDLSLNVSSTGCFPKKERPRILWLGVDGDVAKLKLLVEMINSEMDQLGYPKEEHNYSPHITIGRIRYPQKVTPDVTDFLSTQYEPISWNIPKIILYQSELLPSGAIYSILGTHNLNPR